MNLRFQNSLPIKFWGECVLTAIYLINKLPSEVLQSKSLHEMLFGVAPDLSQLKVFCCFCFAKNSHIKNKFNQRARTGIFIGYPFGQK